MPTVAVQDDSWECSALTDASILIRALHRDWLSVIMSGLEDGMQLPLIHFIAMSRAVLSSSNELVKVAPSD